MPWQNQVSIELTRKSREQIKKFYGLEIESKVYVVTSKEMTEKDLEEQQKKGRSEKELESIKIELKYILGKYFEQTDEIWLVDNEGLVEEVIIHEMIHTKQKCAPNRESMADYLTYKITGNKEYIKESVLKDWEEIEKNYELKRIIERIQKVGDCIELNDSNLIR